MEQSTLWQSDTNDADSQERTGRISAAGLLVSLSLLGSFAKRVVEGKIMYMYDSKAVNYVVQGRLH
jgi:hypothetical protein